MTGRAESRFFWRIVLCCGLIVAALPALMSEMRYPALALSAGGAMAAIGALRLWVLRRRLRRDRWRLEN